MIKNKTKAGMILIYTDEYGNQKAIYPSELLIKDDNTGGTRSLGEFINGILACVEKQQVQLDGLIKANKELTKAIELEHAQLVLDNQEIESLKKKIGGNK